MRGLHVLITVMAAFLVASCDSYGNFDPGAGQATGVALCGFEIVSGAYTSDSEVCP